jgi:diguanylate cyclase (GGDEF)-like protein
MTTPTAEGQPGAGPDRVERIRRRLIWALLLPFCVLMSVAAVEGFSAEDAGHPGIAITALLLAAFGLPLLLAWLGMSISREVDALEHERDELKRLYGRARHDALVDGLTGLGNHRAFQDELARQLEVAKRMDLPLALLLIDVDDLKVVNDTKGHAGGDRLLEAVGRVTASVLRRGDRAFRVGGDEFAILLPEATPEEADGVAAAVLDAVRTLAVPTATGRTRTVTASLGIALFDSKQRITGEDVLVNADLAMYDAKESGRDQLAAYDGPEQPETRIEARISWADMIRDALAEDRFVLHAQPIVDLATGEATQYELLLRMRGTDGELIPPSAFLPVAERFDLMAAIDRWVVTRAIRMVGAELQGGRRLVVEINISGRSAGDPELLELIERELQTSEVCPSQIIFEITETIAVSNIPRAQHFAARLADLGCRFALDDFGAGFGSFYYLKHLPFDVVKIDGDFIKSLPTSTSDQLTVQAIVTIARGLDKRTVAEFVGDDRTIEMLRTYGVDFAQGYHMGKPEPAMLWPAALAGQGQHV